MLDSRIISHTMKKFFRFLCLISSAAYLLVSCNKNIDPVPPHIEEEEEENTQPPDHVDPDDMTISLVISLPDDMTVNNDDASLINELHYELYSFDPQNMCYVLNPEAKPVIKDTLEFTSGMTLELCLAGTDKKDNVLIAWAQASVPEGPVHYDLSDLRCVKCAEGQPLSNDVTRAAYYITHKFTAEGTEYSEKITLSRPHSRINLGTFPEAIRRPDGATLRLGQSSVSLKGISSEFNTIAGLGEASVEFYGKAGSQTAEPYEFTLNGIPSGNIVINDKEYPYLALNYFFSTGIVDMEFVVTGTPYRLEEGETDGEMVEKTSDPVTFEGKLSGINARQDWVTNIVGYFFGSDGRFEYDFRLSFGDEQEGSIIIGDEDEDGYYDESMDSSWGDALGGDDTPTGGGINGGGDDFIDPDHGDGDGIGTDDQEKEKQNNRIETPDAVTWEVYTANGLLMWAEEVRNSTTEQRINLKLFDDIYLKEEWVPVTNVSGQYYGTIDGQGYTIHNLTINQPDVSMVGFLVRQNDDKSQVANLSFANVNIIGGEYTGVVAGGGEIIYNCHVLSGTVLGTNFVGGLVGDMYSEGVHMCTNSAEISGESYIGGIIGRSYKSSYNISECVNYGSVTAAGDYAGGVSGHTGTVTECENHGNVSGNNYVGGIKGSGGAVNCTNKGNVVGNNYVGGISGYGDFKGCINYGDITGVSNVGGLTGKFDGSVNCPNCSNYGNVHGETNVGGCVGFISGQYAQYAKGLINSGNVTGIQYVGGILGTFRNSGSSTTMTFSQCQNSGHVTGDNAVGGLIGRLQYKASAFSDNTISGTIKGKTNVGNLYGLTEKTVTDDGTNVFTGEVVIEE